MEKKFSVIILTEAGDYLLESEEQLHRDDNGFEVEEPHVINEEEKAQRVQADEIFFPYTAVQNVQYGTFTQEAV